MVALCAASTAKAATLYSQLSITDGQFFASQNDAGGFGNFATTYDNFKLTGNGSVSGVSWVGGYFNPPAHGPIAGFTISFWADNAGQPGALLQATTVPGTANETASVPNINGLEFIYSATLSSPFLATAGTPYWLSVEPDINFPPEWGWQAGSGGDVKSYQDFFGSRSLHSVDTAFTLVGSLVPEPSQLAAGALLLAGAVGFTLRRRLSK